MSKIDNTHFAFGEYLLNMSLNHGLTEDFKLIQITFAILEKDKFTKRRVFTVTHPSTKPVQSSLTSLIGRAKKSKDQQKI